MTRQLLSFGQVLRERRIDYGYSLRKFAGLVGVSPTYVSQVEQGNVDAPTAERVKRMAELLEANTSDSARALFRHQADRARETYHRALDLLADVDPIIRQPALMIYGERDLVAPSENLAEFVPNVEVVSLDCGHWIQQERPEETTQAILSWLEQQDATQ